jgi:hypothetical protein
MEKTIQITLSELQALLKEQKQNCADYLIDNFSDHDFKVSQMVKYAPTPDISHLKEVKNDVTNDKGMKWVKASERLPEKRGLYFVKAIHKNDDPRNEDVIIKTVWLMDAGKRIHLTGEEVEQWHVLVEWLDEQAEGQQLTECYDMDSLLKLRGYFGKNDASVFEHWAYSYFDRIIKNITI